MGGITSGIGLASGLDTASIIQQLLSLEARPKLLAQQRLSNIKVQQTAYLDINSRLQNLRSMVSSLRTQPVFDAKSATSSDESILTATASAGAAAGSYTFLVDRLVSTEQWLTRGFSSADDVPVGADAFTFEGAEARLDRDTALADLNGGNGITRGKIRISDGTDTAEVDLSKAATVNEVLDAINAADIGVTAKVRDGGFVLVAASGDGSDITLENAGSEEVIESLGLATGAAVLSDEVVGSSVYALTEATPLSVLNDGNGVFANTIIGQTADFTITVNGDDYKVRLGELYDPDAGEGEDPLLEGKAATVGDALDRINDALSDTDVVARLNAEGNGFELFDSVGTNTIALAETTGLVGSALEDLGFTEGSTIGTVQGGQVLAGMNSTLLSGLKGSAENLGDGLLQIQARDGTFINITINDLDTDFNGLLEQLQDQIDPSKITVELDEMGTGLRFTDVSGGTGNLSISGSGTADDTAVALGIKTEAGGVASNVFTGDRIQRQYVGLNTLVADLNGGKGIGTGTFRVIDANAKSHEVEINGDVRTVADLLRAIDSAIEGDDITVRINDNGDGFVLEDTSGGAGKLIIEDVSGSVASALNIEGEAASAAENFIVGSYETTIEFDPDDSLRDVMTKINEAGVGVTASILNEGVGANPFRLSLTARDSGVAGRTLIDTGGFDLGLTQLQEGQDAKAFFGSSDPAKAVLVTSSSNTITDVFEGLTLNLQSASDEAVTINVASDRSELETKIEDFVTAFNETLDRIDFQSRFDEETEARGPLLGDSTLIGLKNALVRTVLGGPQNVSGRFSNLSQVGLTLGDGARLELDKDKLREAIEQDPQAVEDLLIAREIDQSGGKTVLDSGIEVTNPLARETFSSLGVFARIEELSKTYIDSVDGVLTARGRALDNQVQLQEDRIAFFDLKLADKRTRLEREFASLEGIISNFQAQQAALASLG
ncbi:MAG: flagellar filament capping protein FliD [Phycisphaera sp.]|nr:MAG: flagellar filament capping protein FliD [Phycisphaera sp.]